MGKPSVALPVPSWCHPSELGMDCGSRVWGTTWPMPIGGQSGAAVRRPHGMHQDVGLNPAATRNEKRRTLGRPLHRRCPNCAAGSKWKTGDVKPN